MLKRDNYLKKIRPFYDEDLIKVLTGIRRCGKSVLLEQIIEEIKQKTDEQHIIYINFENIIYSDIKDFMDLNKYINDKITDKKNIIYFLMKFNILKIGKKQLTLLKQQ